MSIKRGDVGKNTQHSVCIKVKRYRVALTI